MAKQSKQIIKPSEVDSHVGWFDRFAEKSALFTSRALFFGFCVVVVVIWAPTILFLDFTAWNFAINTFTTVITYLLVALLNNSQTRANNAIQHKLNAIAEAMASLMDHISRTGNDDTNLDDEANELRQAVGLEYRESTS